MRSAVASTAAKIGALVIVITLVVVGLMAKNKIPTSELTASPTLITNPETKILVIPHHDVVLPEFTSFYQRFSESQRQRVKTVMLISPNHFQPFEQYVLTKEPGLVTSGVKVNPTAFKNEHGITIHLPFIQQTFPEATVVSLLFTRNMPQARVDEVTALVGEYLAQPDTVLIASIDFAHELGGAEAAQKDQETAELVMKKDTQRILSLSDKYLDCSACLYLVVTLASEAELVGPEQFFHTDAATYQGWGSQSLTTSYFGWAWTTPG